MAPPPPPPPPTAPANLVNPAAPHQQQIVQLHQQLQQQQHEQAQQQQQQQQQTTQIVQQQGGVVVVSGQIVAPAGQQHQAIVQSHAIAGPSQPVVAASVDAVAAAVAAAQQQQQHAPDPAAQMNTFLSYVSVLTETKGSRDEIRLKAAQELNENFEVILQSPQYPQFLDHAVKIFLKVLTDGEAHFVAEYNAQQVRKLVLEMIHRLPTNETLKPYVKQILTLALGLLDVENEENTLVCLRIVIELHKTFRPTFNAETQSFLKFVRSIYAELPERLDRIFEPRAPLIRVKDLSEIKIDELLRDTFTTTVVQSEKKSQDETAVSYNLIPKGTLSLKVLQELPIIVVLFYQIYKQHVQQDICDYITLIMNTITLQPSAQQRRSPNFNRDVFVDFMGAQVKTLSFIAYIIRFHHDVVTKHSQQMVHGILGLLELCPQEVCHLRRELLIAIRHIVATDLKQKFVPHMEKLFDERILLGNGWTVRDNLRPLAYSTLADLVHHVRQDLPLADLARAVHLFGKIVHDPTLTTTIQTMSCKLLLNLVDCIKNKSKGEHGPQCRELLMRMLEIFVLKFKTFAKLQLPVLMNRSKATTAQTVVGQQQQQQGVPVAVAQQQQQPVVEVKQEIKTEPPDVGKTSGEAGGETQTAGQTALPGQTRGAMTGQLEEKSKFGFPQQQMSYNVSDYKNLVKTLVCGVKTITWGCSNVTYSFQAPTGETLLSSKKFAPKETLVFIRLVKWAMKALDVYQVPTQSFVGPGQYPGGYAQAGRQAPGRGIGPGGVQTVRTQDDKDVLEHFSGVFSLMTPEVFRDVFSTCIAYMVERIHHNVALQIVTNSFLANPHTSPIFATVLVEYLLERMPEMGSSVERSNLYLRLFKLVFGSVSMFPAENEHMLRPHLHQIVNRSMELAMTAKEPYNYFLLLRALFRSIGGGSHDLLYQEFLPLLPNLLEGLNRLQSGLHKPHMKDLFVELCLTVPVRLSSLLPYLPMLMDPLVSALNGSHTLISQGLRTLELCVDNLQPDFLYEHIQPVRADLMQALWRTLRNTDQVAHVAFRVLGKFGGGNRKMMIEPQRLEYDDKSTAGPAIVVEFIDYDRPIEFPVERVIETAVAALKSSATDTFYHKQCWEAIRCYLAASLNLDDDRSTMLRLFSHPSFETAPIRTATAQSYRCVDKRARDTHQTALTGMFVAAAIRELRQSVLPTMISLVRHYTMVTVAQQAGPFPSADRGDAQNVGLDPLVLIDAIAVIMAHEEKELCKPGQAALGIILETATLILGTKERACQLPLMEYLQERMCSLCYDRAWYSKLGGCIAIKFLFERMSMKWVYDHLFVFLKASMFVMMDLTGEVSSGASDMAKSNLEKMLRLCVAPVETQAAAADGAADAARDELVAAREKALYDVTDELVRLVTSPHTLVREQATYCLRVLAGCDGTDEDDRDAIAKVMEPHVNVLADMVPPTRHQLKHQPANAQIGLMDGNTFCMMLTPKLFDFDLSIKSHKAFFDELLLLCDSDDAVLGKLSCYKSISNLVPIRKSALRCLTAYHCLQNRKADASVAGAAPPVKAHEIFQVLYKALEWNDAELQETAFECMRRFIAGYRVDKDLVMKTMRPLLMSLGDTRNLTLNVVKRLSYLTRLFPSIFKEKLCDQLLQHLNKFMESIVQSSVQGSKGVTKNGENEQKIATIVFIFHQIPDAGSRFIVVLCKLVLQTEKQLMVEASSPFREPLMKFLLRYPAETIDFFLQEQNLKDQQYGRYLSFLVRHAEGKPFRDHLQTNCVETLIGYLSAPKQAATAASGSTSTVDPTTYELRHRAIRLVSIVIESDEQWLANQTRLIDALKAIWCDDEYQEHHNNIESVDITHWKEPKLVVKILLQYFIHYPNDIDLLFQLLRAFCYRFVPDFQFLRGFLENTVAQNYTIEWKQQAFFRFVEHFRNDAISQQLKGHIVQMVLIPCFSDRGHESMNALIGNDSQQNVVSVFINKVIDQKELFHLEDCLRIALLQFSCLLVEQASQHIHDAANKRQGNKLRKLMTFAWPCLLGKNCVDATTRYHGHLLLAHIIVKFAINKKIVLQVFHSLVKAHAQEARAVVKQALEILTPAMPLRMEGGNTMLIHWTKKIIVEEGHSLPQLYHILQLVVRHYKVYYPVRHHLIQYIVNSINRLGFGQTSTLEHRKLAVELAEVVVKWELQRIKEENENAENPADASSNVDDPSNTLHDRKRIALANAAQQPVAVAVGQGVGAAINAPPRIDVDAGKPIKPKDADAVLNFLLRLACHVNESSNTALPPQQAGGTPGELLSKRCVTLLKTALKPDVWPQQCDLKLAWLDKVFQSVENPDPNYANISTALELLIFLLGVMKHDRVLACLKPLQKGLGSCLYSKETKIVGLVHNLLSKLTVMFPIDYATPNVGCKHEELDVLYATVGKTIAEGLNHYEKNVNASPSVLFGPLMILKACCSQNHAYIDRFIASFMRVLLRMTKEHLLPAASQAEPAGSDKIANELLILSLDLVKTRVVVMSVEMRKQFIGQILVGLIEKTQDIKVMRAITKMLEEWIKNRTSAVTLSQAPSLREKSILLVKMMQYVEKRFPDDVELNTQFLELVNHVYRDEQLKTTELCVKLEPAFMSGLRCTVQPAIRAKFFQVLDASMRRRVQDRLMYVVCSQAWDAIGSHYWIKQCIELLIVTAVASKQIEMKSDGGVLPSVGSVVSAASADERKSFVVYTSKKHEPDDFSDAAFRDVCAGDATRLSGVDVEPSDADASGDVSVAPATEPKVSRARAIRETIAHHSDYLDSARKIRVGQFLNATSQLCHMDTPLAERVWLDLFPRLWAILDAAQHEVLTAEIVPFVCSGTHVVQKDCSPSAITTFVEALSHCTPSVPIKPPLMKYLGRSHNLWHRMTLNLEQIAFENAAAAGVAQKQKRDPLECYDFEPEHANSHDETMDSLSDMYSLLCEEDMWAGLWQRHAKFRETNVAIAYEQQGFFEQAQGAYEVAMARYKQDPSASRRECLLWTDRWIRCAKELNQWDLLVEYGVSKTERNPFLILESAWRIPNWTLTKEALAQVEYSCPKEMTWRVNLYRGFLAICHAEEKKLQLVERCVENASTVCMKEWRRLPRIVGHAHLPLLQAAQQIMELQEASQIHQGLLHASSSRSSIHDMKAIVKTWRNRLPVIADDLSHWSDIFTWRQHHYQFISNHYDGGGGGGGAGGGGAAGGPQHEQQASNHAMLGVHASAQAIIHFGKIARKHNLTGVCHDSLSRIYTIPSIPIVDCFQKIRQQVKCYLQMAAVNGKNELQEGLEVVEKTDLGYFTKEMKAEFYAMKGVLLAQIGRSDDANKAFSAAVQLHDVLIKAWALWGEYLEAIFTRDRSNIFTGVSAITCFLHACRHQNESKSRKYLAKVLWLLTYDDDKSSLMEALDKYCVGVPAVQWLPWTPQLVGCLVQYEGDIILNLLSQVGRVFPQAVYFPMRTLYLMFKIEQRVGHKSNAHKTGHDSDGANHDGAANPTAQQQQAESGGGGGGGGGSQQGPKASPAVMRCTKILQILRDIHPIVLLSLEGFVDQMNWFRETWYEEVLKQLRQCLAKCYAITFENRANVGEAKITPHLRNFVKILVSTFGIGIENVSSSNREIFSSAASESLARRKQATEEDPVFQKMKSQFTNDFDFTQPGALKLHNLIVKLKKWIKILEKKVDQLPKSFLIEEKCRFLSNFSSKTAEVELPGEFLLPKHTHYYVRIARFMPRVDVVQKHNTAARRLYIRGHNGKIYPYLVIIDSGLGDARKEERVLQLLRMLNHYLGKQKETSRRFLHFTVPRVVAVSPQMRLVEDNPASLSLLDIYKKGCADLDVDHGAPIALYYERLAGAQARGAQASHSMLRDILRAVHGTMIPKTILKNWATRTFPTPTDYWTFRKMFTLQLSLACFAEYVLYLTRLNPDMMYLHQDSGLINIAYFKFDVDDSTGELDVTRPVPFRLTPNIVEFVSGIGVSGPLTASMIAAARCLVQPNFKVQSILRAILKDEMIAGHKKKLEESAVAAAAAAVSFAGQSDGAAAQQHHQQQQSDRSADGMEGEHLISMVNKAVSMIVNRLNSLANLDVNDSKVGALVAAASSQDNLCRMDPAWHPWM